MTGNVTLFVNSCDAFSDCWTPFFKLLNCYWPDCDIPIILNTEKLDFVFPGLSVVASKAGQGVSGKLTWSEALIRGLALVKTEFILYVQEDYFLNAPVDSDFIKGLVATMKRMNFSTVQLTAFGSGGKFRSDSIPFLWKVDQHAPYRMALQAALWNCKVLNSYLRPHENAWQFEIFGTLRARRRSDLFLTLDRDKMRSGDLKGFSYVKTGIIKGQWFGPAVIELFERHSIDIDFTKRGFFKQRSRFVERSRTLWRVVSHPISLIRSL